MTTDTDSLRELSSIFNDRALKSSPRLLILICLSMNRKLGFTELSKLTGLAKGRLGNHLLKLNNSGYIIIIERSFFSSKRITVKITEKGLLMIRKYIKAINELELNEKKHNDLAASKDADSL